MSGIKNLKGMRFNRLVVLEEAGRSKEGRVIWLCRCDCGKLHKTLGKYLLNGDATSCGCRKLQILAETTTKQTIHNMSGSRIYQIWNGMKERCYNSKADCYKNYGGRGVGVCKEWMNFEGFYEWAMRNGYDDNLTIDRIDSDRDYEPENCRWADKKLQANNTRRNHRLTYKGVTRTMAEWAEIIGIKYTTLRGRINTYKWSVEKALETPVKN